MLIYGQCYWIEEKKIHALKRSQNESIITRQSGVLDLPESYWPVICFVQRIAVANNWEMKKINYEIKTCSIVFNDMFKNANIEKPNPRDC